MEQELKACPFCGKQVEYISREDFEKRPDKYPYGFGVHCINPDCFPYELKRWNTRPIEDALQSELDTLKQSVKEAVKEISDIDETYDQLTRDEALDLLRSHGLLEEQGLTDADRAICGGGG